MDENEMGDNCVFLVKIQIEYNIKKIKGVP
jgi:hypothetical protein